MPQRPMLTRTVWILGWVSLLTDLASEMLYPVMPLYLEQIGFSVLGIGILEGIAQGVAGLSKGYFGHWSDATRRRLPFVRWGYSLSAVAKPLMAVWKAPLWVLGARTLDRLGKGVRTGARDALLSTEATAATKGRVFGFHRGMDTLGAALGPLLALLYLSVYPEAYRHLFFLALLPGLGAVAATFLLSEPHSSTPALTRPAFHFRGFLKYLPRSSPAYRKLLVGLLAFALVNSSDFFLLLLLKERGLSDGALIGFYIFFNLVYALAAYPAGSLGDRWGLRRVFIVGLLLFATVYAGMAAARDWWVFGALFALYGLFAAATEGIAKAWISNLTPEEELATALGTYEGLRSVATLLASSFAGWVWFQFGAPALFYLTAGAAFLIALYFYRWKD